MLTILEDITLTGPETAVEVAVIKGDLDLLRVTAYRHVNPMRDLWAVESIDVSVDDDGRVLVAGKEGVVRVIVAAPAGLTQID